MKRFKKLTAGFLGVVMALSVCSFTALAEEYVAQIVDGSQFKTLQAAIDAAEKGATIELIANTKENVTIASDDELTIDLNGKVLNGGTVSGKAALTNNGTVTIMDSKESGEIMREDTGSPAHYVIDNQGTMTIEGGYIHNDSGDSNGHGSSLIRNGGVTLEKTDGYAVLNIEGGIFEQDNFIVIKNDDYGQLNITGGEFNSKNESAIQNWAKADISGGEINGIVWTSVWDSSLPNSETKLSDDVKVNGIIKAELYGNVSGVVPNVSIDGGNFDVTWDIDDDVAKYTNVTNGNFSNGVPKEYLAEDSNLVKDEDGKFVVMDETEFEESAKEFYISDEDDLKLAIANQADGVTWILEDTTYELESTIKITKDITIEGNGAVLSYIDEIYSESDAKERCGIHIDSGANVEINDLTIDGKGNIRHGINVYSYKNGDITSVEVNNVKIVDCLGYAIVNNASKVTVTDLETSGNGWGGINVDNSDSSDAREGGAELIINSANIKDSNSVKIENATNRDIDAVIKDGTYAGDVFIADGVENAELRIISGTFAKDVEKYIDKYSHIVKIDGEYVVKDEEEYEDYLDSKRPTHSYELEEGRVDRNDEDKEEPVVTTKPEEEAGPFSDVGKDNPNYDAIIKVYENGWMEGIGDGVFAPNGTLTRAMGAMVLWNKAGKPEPQNVAPFLDVTGDAWYAKAVAWAYEQGIIAGYDAATFGPDDALTTEQFTRMNDIATGNTPAVYVGGAPNATRGWVASLLAL